MEPRHLVTESLPDGGLLVIDTEAGRSHTLNAAATAVWRAWSAGVRALPELAARIAEATPLPADEGIVHTALGQLKAAGLVREDIPTPPIQLVARRRLLQLAAAAAFALPLIETIVTPSPANAQSRMGPPPAPPPPPSPGRLRRPQR